MNTLVEGYLAAPTNDFQFNCRTKSVFCEENHVFGFKPGFNEYDFSCEGKNSKDTNGSPSSEESSSSSLSSFEEAKGQIAKENDHSDTILKFISEMLMEEEDLENKPCMLHDCLALQATEKSLYDVLLNNNNNRNHNNMREFDFEFESLISDAAANRQQQVSPPIGPFCVVSNSLSDQRQFYPPSLFTAGKGGINSPFSFNSEFLIGHDSEPKNNKKSGYYLEMTTEQLNARDCSPNSLGVNKNRNREDSDFTEEEEEYMRSSKQLANNIGETEPLEMYDNVLLCSNSDRMMQTYGEANKKSQQNEQQSKGGSNRGRRPRGGDKKQDVVIIMEVVDLRSLLMQCAQAVVSFDSRTVNNLLLRIRQHSSPQGDSTERVAHYFANALEARLAGTAFNSKRISAAEILEAYKMFITACPFKKMTNLLANKTIGKLVVSTGATTLHIIDFGILYGYQWPCLIQALSERPCGPPKLRITGIDFPQPGFRPMERVEDTGRRLAKYCDRFGVPFEYNAIAQKWDTIRVEDVKIEKNELVVVNSLYRLHNLLDETVMVNSPRDAVLKLIKKINPEVFIHGVANGTYNTPFFITRFREAFFHYSSMFDMFEATIAHEDENRLLFEEQIFGKEAINVIACEGTERIQRPETYKQWKVRSVRAGFRQLRLGEEIVNCVRSKVKTDYHKDFSVDEDGKWMLQGWKGRVINAISCWQPVHNS